MNTNYLYLIIFAILIAEKDVEVNLQQVFGLTTKYVSIRLGIAATKAILIAMFYQHLRYEPRSLSTWAILGIVIASILMSLTFVQLTLHGAFWDAIYSWGGSRRSPQEAVAAYKEALQVIRLIWNYGKDRSRVSFPGKYSGLPSRNATVPQLWVESLQTLPVRGLLYRSQPPLV